MDEIRLLRSLNVYKANGLVVLYYFMIIILDNKRLFQKTFFKQFWEFKKINFFQSENFSFINFS